MIVNSAQKFSRSIAIRIPQVQRSFFSTSSPQRAQNRIFANVRTPDELHTLTFTSAIDNRPLITLWSASWCSTCQVVKPLIKSLIEDEKVGEAEGGLAYAEVEIDSTLIGDLPVKFMVCICKADVEIC